MTVNSPEKIAFVGYGATDTTLFKDPTEYSTTNGAYVEKISGAVAEKIDENSKIRLKVQLKSVGGVNQGYMKVEIDGVQVWEQQSNNSSYTSFENDIDLGNFERGDAIKVYIKTNDPASSETFIKDFEIAGARTPITW